MKRPLYLYGAGGLGKEVLALVQTMDSWEMKAFIDNRWDKIQNYCGYPVISLNEVKTTFAYVLLCFGDPKSKSYVYKQCYNTKFIYPIIKHSQSLILDPKNVEMGEGTIITAGVTMTTNIKIGKHVLINLHCTVGHDVTIDDFTSIMPGANISGNVCIGREVLIGAAATILNGIRIGDGARIGAGAVVTKDVKSGETVTGIPAKPINS